MHYAVRQGYLYWKEEGKCNLMVLLMIVIGIEEQLNQDD
jgi:hypothetical protein